MPPVLGNSAIIDQLTRYGDGTHTWAGVTVEYAIPATPPWDNLAEAIGFTPMTARQAAFAEEAFELWDDLIVISLVNTGEADADITMAYSSNTRDDGTYARTEVDDPPFWDTSLNRDIEQSRLWMSTTWNSLRDANIEYGVGTGTMIHEIGHALGLRHPGDYDASDDPDPTYEDDAEYAQDTGQYTIMSYFRPGKDGSGADHGGRDGATPLLHDIMAIQALYGADMTTRTGNTTYGHNSTAGRAMFDFTVNIEPVIAIWDAGGSDTLDASGYFSADQRIDLNAGAFSDIGGLVKNVAIAYGVTIENAVGSWGDDTIIGNQVANRLTGNAGRDILDGGRGSDVMVGGANTDTYYVDTEPQWPSGGAGGPLVRNVVAAPPGGVIVLPTVAGDQVIEKAGEGTNDLVYASVSFRLSANVEHLTLTGSTNISGDGNSGDNFIYGNAGDNILRGHDGADVIDGKAGSDMMIGGRGDDTYFVETATRYTVGTLATKSSLAALSAGPKVRFGDEGVLPPGIAGDSVLEEAGQGYDTVLSSIGYRLSTNVEKLVLTGKGGNWGNGNSLDNGITGNAASNRLSGEEGNDFLSGGAGRDVLIGGAGKDTMQGGDGQDFFDFNRVSDSAVGASRDVISGFSRWQGDRIDLRSIDAVSGGSDNAFVYAGTEDFAIYKASHAGTYGMVRAERGIVQIDIGGNGIVDMEIKVSLVTLQGSDFVL